VMLALRAELRKRGAFQDAAEPNLAALTDLVALGTVADVVPLDANNRILVAQGLKRLRAGQGQPGLEALLRAAGRDSARANAFDLGFVLGPRLNAAGRLADMSLGIECLVTDDAARAANCAQELDRLNRERRRMEGGMLEQARLSLSRQPLAGSPRFRFELLDAWRVGLLGRLGAAEQQHHVHGGVRCEWIMSAVSSATITPPIYFVAGSST